MQFHSEYGQDKWLHENIFNGKRDGVFIEVGALDGILHSNTLFFERELGWVGALVEANPEQFCKILRCGRNIVPVLAACGRSGMANFSIVPAVAGWGGIRDTMEEKHLQRISAVSPATTDFMIPSISLDSVIAMLSKETGIDYVSIDVEGAEPDVIENSMLIDSDRIGVVGIENNYETELSEKAMNKKGFKKFHRLGVDDFYRRG
jgi:hypothetical protein